MRLAERNIPDKDVFLDIAAIEEDIFA